MMRSAVLLLSLLSGSAFSSNFDTAAGVGFQFGGLGVQLSGPANNGKLYGAVGLAGVAVGYEQPFDGNHKQTWGVAAGFETFNDNNDSFLMGTFNYHLDGFKSKGFVFGVGVGIVNNRHHHHHDSDSSTSLGAAISLGYKF